jgi:hypothetical protein
MKIKRFSTIFSESIQISNFIKIRPVGAKLFHADGQADMTRLTDALRNFGNAPKNVGTNGTELSIGFHGSVVSCTQTRHSAVTVVNQGYSVGKGSTLKTPKWRSRFTIHCRNKIFSLRQKNQACCAATYPLEGGSFQRGGCKVAGAWS